ncbi:MAG: alpha/beta hydrolase [Deltaproteobacteria bacterium]|nr:alpha/beta hydrolase [Deltaproteobacteria bacterium]
MNTRQVLTILLLNLSILSSGCASLGIALLYKKVSLPDTQVVKNIDYSQESDSNPVMNRLDLFLPKGKNWPTMIFVHGGGWNTGDKDLKVAGADVYGNIGRYFASQGIGTAVISYRLMPGVDWKTQTMDVAKAVAWVYEHIHEYNGDSRSIFLAGHSAGAQLSSRVALDPSALQSMGLSPKILCGVILISGAGYNFMNQEAYDYGKQQGAIEALFNKEELSKILRKKLSPIFFARQASPPFLILYAAKDEKEIKHDSLRLDEALKRVGAQRQLYSVPRVNHKSMILALSHADKFPASMMMVFMRTCECGRSPAKMFNSAPTPPEKAGKSPRH